MAGPDTSRLRQDWQRRWGSQRDEDFDWSLTSEVAPQLKELVAERGPWSGLALDVGCGAGVATRYLGESFDHAVGIDIAVAAVQQAKAGRAAPDCTFAAADALRLPFLRSSFGLVFDRGCMQNLPPAAWPSYFSEIDRVLAPSGTFVLLVSRLAGFPRLLSKRGLKARLNKYRPGSDAGSEAGLQERLRRTCPASLRIEKMTDFDFVTSTNKVRRFTHAVMTKA